MDDILSAALGQSGLNLSFFEGAESTVDSTQTTGGNAITTTTTGTGRTNILPIGSIKQEIKYEEENEDVSDLLSLLGDVDSNIKEENSTGVKRGSQNVPPYLFHILKYEESDDDENNVPLSQSSSNSNSPCSSPSFIGSLTSQFPKIKPPQHKNIITIANGTATATKPIKKVTVKSHLKNSGNLNGLSKPTSSSKTNKVNQIIIDKVSNNGNNSISNTLQRSVSSPAVSKLLEHANKSGSKLKRPESSNELSDMEKRKKSIQHVLASPNLTVREKQFLMKSAISANLKTPIHSLSSAGKSLSTPNKGLSSLLQPSIPSPNMMNFTADEVDEDDENVMIHTETFAEYMPAKVKVGYLHPDPVVETSSMASVIPPDVWYSLLLPRDVIDERKLSALQLESIVYASQQHEKLLPNGRRAGFLIGDGAGVGKGRTVAGVIFENYLHGRKRAIWLSVSNDLRYDAIRDLRDIGCHAKVLPLNKFKYDEKITAKVNGKFKKGCIFATYSALIGETSSNAKFKSRLDQILHWCGKDFDGVIILDECHKAKNLMPVGSSKPTKTGITVLKLQDQLPKARIVYCSATGASEPKNMAYMNRLGLWGPGTAFKEFSDFLNSVEKRGVGAMEMVAMDMKLRGMYIARQLSFNGVTFDIKEVKLCPSFIEMYDSSVKLWLDAREKFHAAAELVGLDGKGKKTMWGQFWSGHQRFFKYLCIAAKVRKAVDIAKDAINVGKCVIFGLQSTGEARTLDQIDDLCGELNDFISTTKGVFSTLVEKHFPTTQNPDSQQNISLADDRKRKREWRKPGRSVVKRKKGGNGDVEVISSSGSSDSDDDYGNVSSKDETNNMLSDRGSDVESGSEEQDSFSNGSSSGSDDEDAWLRAASEKKPKKAKKVEKVTLKKVNQSVDSSMNALAAAGLNLGRQYSWANTTLVDASSSDNMKSNRGKVFTPSGLSQQLLSVKDTLFHDGKDAVQRCRNMKQNLLDQLEVIAPYLPPNTLDELIDELGGPEYVAEMTGRKGRVVAKDDGSFAYEPRSKDDVPLEILNVAEKKRFMDGIKFVAVISEAASSGISLQADRREKNQRRRVHITLELPWSADKAIQQFGRSHRSNQVSAPEYLFLISELAGEQRFASIVAKRLESLGALTHGDRRATESRDLSRYNFDTKYGRQALDSVLKSVVGHEKPLVPPPSAYKGNFFDDVKESLAGIGLIQKDDHSGMFSMADKDYTNISRFLNRILGLTVALQNALFQYFTDSLAHIVKEAKRSGRFDEGIVDLGSQGESVVQKDVKTFLCPSTSGKVTSELITVSVERGLSFSKACEMCAQTKDPIEGFWLSSQLRNGRITAVLVLKHVGTKKNMYSLYRPNIGLVLKPELSSEIMKRYNKSAAEDVQRIWNEQYESSEHNCSHAFWRGYCKKKICGLPCEVGARKRTCYILCGSVLSVWAKVETILSCQPAPYSKMQIIRSKLDNGIKLVGLLIPSNCIEALVKILSNDENIETL